jgi:hypothetical protein
MRQKIKKVPAKTQMAKPEENTEIWIIYPTYMKENKWTFEQQEEVNSKVDGLETKQSPKKNSLSSLSLWERKLKTLSNTQRTNPILWLYFASQCVRNFGIFGFERILESSPKTVKILKKEDLAN